MTEEGDYKDDKKQGEWIAYQPGGKTPSVISNYKNGKLHGTMKQYSRRGKLQQEMSYKDGLKHGKTVIYDKRGKTIKEVNYKNGLRVIEGKENTPGTFTP
jgi:antitoxin component YwqK of YwqJK toxin-antitoxin module